MENRNVLEMRAITKSFPGVVALDGVDFSLQEGEIHCLVGENGAGKSTLIKILAGALRPDHGGIYLKGNRCVIDSTRVAQSLGINFVFQELNIVDQLSVAENISLGQESRRLWFLNKGKDIALAKRHLEDLKINVDPAMKVINLSVAMKRIIGIARALISSPSIIVMDEPTAALNENELGVLFEMLKDLRSRGISIIYISHRIDEIFRLGDRVTILRDGKVVATRNVADIDRTQLVMLMTGKRLDEMFPGKNQEIGGVVLELRNVENRVLKDINLTLRKGEVLGIAGLQGSGRTELARAIFGADRFDKGELFIDNRKVEYSHPRGAISRFVGLVPEERRTQGIVSVLSVKDNIVLPSLGKVARYGFLDIKRIASITKEFIRDLRIKTPSEQQKVMLLSGGNQQKVVIAKWLCTDSNILLLDEPTRGIDVGAKIEIFNIIIDLARKGKSVIIFSSELEELVGLCNRVVVLKGGRKSGELVGEEIDPDRIVQMAS